MFAIIADDFTGACDAGVQFRKRGLSTSVLIFSDILGVTKEDFDVVVIDTETRNLSAEIASERLKDVAKALKSSGIELVYKKVDSTLRGNIGSELDAVLEVFGFDAIIVTPSFPEYGRTVLDGHLLIDGTTLELTEFARDPVNPTLDSDIVELIKCQTRRKVGMIRLSLVRTDEIRLREEIRKLIVEGKEILVIDAETQSDLVKIAEASINLNVLLCGSAGLSSEASRLLISRFGQKGIIIVSGSSSEVSINQIIVAQKKLGIKVYEPNLLKILRGTKERTNEVRRIVFDAEKSLSEGFDIALRLSNSKNLITEAQKEGEKSGLNNIEVAGYLLSFLSDVFATLSAKHCFGGLVLIGGDTAVSIMRTLDSDGVVVEQEILPGVPLCHVKNGRFKGLRVVTKAGGFGDDATLVNIIKYLKGGMDG